MLNIFSYTKDFLFNTILVNILKRSYEQLIADQMKSTLLARIAIGLSMAIVAMPGASFANATALVTQASDLFSCNISQMSTTVQTERGAVSLIRWVDHSFPPPYSPEQRCQIVSERFNNFDNNGTLKYIKADSLNNLPILSPIKSIT